MMGHSHALSGAALASALLPVAPVHGTTQQIAWVAAWSGMSMLPDLDSRGSTIGRLWGPITAVVSTGVGKVARGHRNGTHDAILAPVAFGGLATLSTLHPWASMALLAFAIGLAAKSLHFMVPGNADNTWVGNLALSWAAAWWLTDTGHATFPWLPIAVAGGVLVHIAGDALTVGGCPVPFTWIDGKAQRYTLGLFKTGAGIERLALAPAFLLLALILVYQHTGVADWWPTVRDTLEAAQ